MREYNIDGFILKINEEQFNYCKWSRQVSEEQFKILNKYENIFNSYDTQQSYSKEVTIIDILDKLFDDLEECSAELLSEIVNDARNHNVYDITIRKFVEEYVIHAENDYMCLKELFDKIDDIYNKMTGNHIDRQINNAARGRIVGGGFGVSGAVKGMVTASVMNSVIDSYYDRKIENEEANDYRECINRLNEIKKANRTWEIIVECIDKYVFNIMWGYKQLQTSWGIVMDHFIDFAKCDALLESAQAVPEKKREIALQALKTDPTNSKVYDLLLSIVGDENNELEKAAIEIANYDLHKVKLWLIEKAFLAFDFSNLYNLKNYSVYTKGIKELRQLFGINDDKYEKCLEKIKEKYEECELYFGDKWYETVDEVLQAKDDNEKFVENIKNIDWNNEKDLIELENWIKSELKSDLKEKYIGDINAKLEVVSKNNRTVNGVEYDSSEVADKIRNAYDTINKIIAKEYTEYSQLQNTKQLLNEIKDDDILNKSIFIVEEIERYFNLCKSVKVDTSNKKSRVELNRIMYEARKVKTIANALNVYEKKFEEWYGSLYIDYVTVNGTVCLGMADADNKYFEAIEKSLKYKEYLVKQAEQPQKKGFFSKIATGVKDTLQKSNENTYNWLTKNGTELIPNISQEEKEMMLSNDREDFELNNEAFKIINEFGKVKLSKKKIKVDIDSYKLYKKEVNKEELRNYINSKCKYCGLAPVENKEACYNVSLSSGTFAVVIKNSDLNKKISLNSFGVHSLLNRQLDLNNTIIVENCSKLVAREVEAYLRKNKITVHIIDLKYLLSKNEISRYKVLNFDESFDKKGYYFVVLKFNHVSYSNTMLNLVNNHKLLRSKCKFFINDSIHLYGDNYVILGVYPTMNEAKETCEKMIGKSIFSEADKLDTNQCQFKIIFDKSNKLLNRVGDECKNIKKCNDNMINNTDDEDDEQKPLTYSELKEEHEELKLQRDVGVISEEEYNQKLSALLKRMKKDD